MEKIRLKKQIILKETTLVTGIQKMLLAKGVELDVYERH